MTETYAHAITGLLQRRQELQDEAATLRERMATIQTDVEAIDRVLDSLGYEGELENRTARTERIVLFYRNELRGFILKELRGSDRPLSTRELAERICGAEGKAMPDKRLLSDVVKRASKALRMMRLAKLVAVSHYERSTCFWQAST
ncbi:hypothetical protein [Methylobacterium sp. R2-1]|uniref:hypothetical protein n=1 Tax=Methylobacterium sp. R2-1 TaxID=2587064 RepID=UPI001608E915|nr:hypothetical protein [Methylobacterium sp. R2-1]MBB2964270.1 hypothetical protein [Methylobacterium sp. R2-1]